MVRMVPVSDAGSVVDRRFRMVEQPSNNEHCMIPHSI